MSNNSSGVSRLQGRCVARENNVVLIFISGFVKNQEEEISNFKMSHWKQVVLQNTLKFSTGGDKEEEKHSKLSGLLEPRS